MKPDIAEIIGYVSIAVIVISLFFIGMRITGYTIISNETAMVNVTVATSAALNFTTDFLDFGVGTIIPGQRGLIWTNGTTIYWNGSQPTGELVLENIGNINLSITLQTNKSVEDFLGGTSPRFGAKVSDTVGHEGACGGTTKFSNYNDINSTAQVACSVFQYDNSLDSIDIDFFINASDNAVGLKTIGIIAIGSY